MYVYIMEGLTHEVINVLVFLYRGGFFLSVKLHIDGIPAMYENVNINIFAKTFFFAY